jgi:hypothetical protein
MKIRLKYFIVLFFSAQFVRAQCAMCKAVVESGDNSMAKGLNNGILYLMAMPYLLVVLGGFVFYKYYLKKKV